MTRFLARLFGVSGLFVAVSATLFPAQAALVNISPPPGAILNLSGQPMTGGQREYTVDFTATSSLTTLTFGFRQDSGYLSFSNVKAIDTALGGANLIANGDFSAGDSGSRIVPNWTYANPDNASYGGKLSQNCGYNGGDCWLDGAAQAYDYLSQSIETAAGHTYAVSFWLDGGPGSSFSEASTNGRTRTILGNGANLVLYAAAATVTAPAAPENPTWVMMTAGFAGAGLVAALRRRKGAASA